MTDLTSGPLMKKILLFSLPLVATGILQLLFNAADLVVAGRMSGPTSLAAVGACGALINMIVNMFMGLAVGAGVAVGDYSTNVKRGDFLRCGRKC